MNQRALADELLDQIIADVSYLDEHRPPELVLGILAQQVRIYREVAEWTERLKLAEHGPAGEPSPSSEPSAF